MIDSGECDRRVNYGCNISRRLPADICRLMLNFLSSGHCCPQQAVLKLTEVTELEMSSAGGTKLTE